jgi:hypothetical protein
VSANALVKERTRRLARTAKALLAAKRKLREADMALPIGTAPIVREQMIAARNALDAVGYRIAQMLSAAMAGEETKS